MGLKSVRSTNVKWEAKCVSYDRGSERVKEMYMKTGRRKTGKTTDSTVL